MRAPRPGASKALLQVAQVLERAVESRFGVATVPTSVDTLKRLAEQLKDLARGVNVNKVFDPPKNGRPSLERENMDCAYTYLRHRAISEATYPNAAQRKQFIKEAVAAANATRAAAGLPPIKRTAIEKYARTFHDQAMAIIEDFEKLDTKALRAEFAKRSPRPE